MNGHTAHAVRLPSNKCVAARAKIGFFLVGLTVASVCAAQDSKLTFAPSHGIIAEVAAHGNVVTVALKGRKKTITEIIQVDTERHLRLSVDDYNFDGVPDFAIAHTDDGMGTSTVYQIYVYSPKQNKFIPLSPKCGDEFINVRVSKRARQLTNSYWADNRLNTCAMHY